MKKTRLVLVLLTLALILSIMPSTAIAQTPINCSTNADVQAILNQITEPGVAKWIRDLSGENEVTIGGRQYTIRTRYTSELFNPFNWSAKAYPYLTQELLSLGYVSGTTLTDHSFTYSKLAPKSMDPNVPDPEPVNISTADAKNLVLTIPGHGPNANQIVYMTAHLDSTTNWDGDPVVEAPGAEDNAAGISALMEAARLFRFYKFDRTIKIIFFTAEEQGLWGSQRYVADFHSEMPNALGVVNLDMFGYDADQDKCIELHVGSKQASQAVGNCFTTVSNNYNLGLSFDYLIGEAQSNSDHSSFWRAGVGAIEVLENYSNHSSSYGCQGRQDRNPYYHKRGDRISNMYMPATHRIVQAGVGTVATMAGPMGKCYATDPRITATPQEESIYLTWQAVAGAPKYNIYRSERTCGVGWTLYGETTTNSFVDTNITFDKNYFYQIQVVEPDGVCMSAMSNCAVARVPKPEEPPIVTYFEYLPVVIWAE